MFINSITSGYGARHSQRRVGRGIGSGLGKTCGRGHKGQKSRSGGFHKVGFEGGQMPLQRRLPKRGFNSYLKKDVAEITVTQLNLINTTEVDVLLLKQLGVISKKTSIVKVIGNGEILKPYVLRGIRVSKSVDAAIQRAGGKVE